jgi:D-alanine-D-alanine ligase
MDKDLSRRLAGMIGVRSARYQSLSWHASLPSTEQFCQRVAAEFGWPLFVKPCSAGSSVGVHKVYNMQELLLAVADARRYDKAVLVEEFITGREIELAVLENISTDLRPHVSIPGEIVVTHPDGFYSYTAKYLESEHSRVDIPANLSEKLSCRLQNVAADVFIALKCSGLARVDFFVDDAREEIYFNEINSLPGFTQISMYPKLWQASGISYRLLLTRLIDLAIVHHHCREQLVTNYG